MIEMSKQSYISVLQWRYQNSIIVFSTQKTVIKTQTVFYPNRMIYADCRDTKTGLAKKRQCYILMSDDIYAEKDDSYALYFSTIARQSL